MTPYLKKWLIVTATAPLLSAGIVVLAASILLLPIAALIWPSILQTSEGINDYT